LKYFVINLQKTAYGWRELLVDISPEESSGAEFHLVVSEQITPPVSYYLSHLAENAKLGTRIEISPETQRYSYEILSRMGKGSCWLCIDYGQMGPSSDSLRVNLRLKIGN
jgi:SAM-dependent MidA family methyltransferase